MKAGRLFKRIRVIGLRNLLEVANFERIIWRQQPAMYFQAILRELSEVKVNTPLSQNERQTLDRQMATLTFQINEIAHLLEGRLGSTNDMAASARLVSDQVKKLANRIRRQNVLQQESGQQPMNKVQSA